MQKLKEKLNQFLIFILTLPFRLLVQVLAALVRSTFYQNKPVAAKKESSKSNHRNGQVVESEIGAAVKKYLRLVAKTNQILQDNQPGKLQAGITLEQTAADLADFDTRLKKLNRSEGQKARRERERQTQAQAELEKQRAEQESLAQIQKETLRARRSQSAQKGWQTRRYRQEEKQ